MATEFNPKPAEDYETLRKQFNSLVRLYRNGQIHTETLHREIDSLMSQLALLKPAELNSQRDANAELTTLLEQQEIELARLRTQLHNTSTERDALREELLIKPGTGQTAYRDAADIYYQLAQECEIPEGGSLVGYIDNLRDEAGKVITCFRQYGKLVQAVAIDQLEKALDASNQGKSDHETM
jgi:hypothetical protein